MNRLFRHFNNLTSISSHTNRTSSPRFLNATSNSAFHTHTILSPQSSLVNMSAHAFPTTSNGQHEQDPRWTAVDHYTRQHLDPSSKPNHALLQSTLTRSRAAGLPNIEAQPVLGKFLALQCRLGRATHALEVGTLGGYTALWLATENPGLRVTTVEADAHHAAVARENIAAAGPEVAGRIEVLEGKGLEVLPELAAEVREGKREEFGFVWIDADKGNNWNYFELALGMSKKGACLAVDNVVRRGGLVDEKKAESGDEGTVGARQLVEKVGKDERVEAVVMQTVAEKSYDGFLMAVVK